ncbi:AraC family transcriptional regulator [Seonamhaeicola marinus]|uniref:AraC family transcriptional regulator n=1 Tax=Seonamhaeicola marinus TaxID=1912246 RepID=A0A5D0HRX9_9FLAO|nr:AraC family transcriptional regulator [Seonamhaeicola marinus]TYA74038.1 AraC family transcriptional regulator [Seonamhaeicola marinus]
MKPLLEKIALSQEQRSFKYFNVAVERFEPYWHYHPEIELTLIIKGSGTRFVGDSILPFEALDLVLIGENVPHHWISVSEDEAKSHNALVIQFDKAIFKAFPECADFNLLFDKAKRGIHFFKPSDALVSKIINFESLSATEQLSELLLILDYLCNDRFQKTLSSKVKQVSSKNGTTQNKMSKTTNYILANLDKKLTVQHMADFTHMVPQSFCRWFKSNSGHSFISFLNITRIEQACHFLLTTNLSVQNIAYSCGFESISHFNRTFLKLKEVSPRVYRKRIH